MLKSFNVEAQRGRVYALGYDLRLELHAVVAALGATADLLTANEEVVAVAVPRVLRSQWCTRVTDG